MKLFFVFLVIFFVSCSYKKNDTCNINGERSYLKTDPLNVIRIPDDIMFPIFDQKYDIPNVDNCEIKDENLSICPPDILD